MKTKINDLGIKLNIIWLKTFCKITAIPYKRVEYNYKTRLYEIIQ